MGIEEKKDTVCLRCGYEWKSRLPPEKNPYFDHTQCPKCYGYSAAIIEEYRSHLNELKQTFSSDDINKFKIFYKFAVEHGYVHNPKSRDKKLQRLLEDLAKST